ncbi:unnamed protein product [Dicrocoelium dendriticum]|nr:unnamed protein product [Dicrocoelium dendriticum]
MRVCDPALFRSDRFKRALRGGVHVDSNRFVGTSNTHAQPHRARFAKRVLARSHITERPIEHLRLHCGRLVPHG